MEVDTNELYSLMKNPPAREVYDRFMAKLGDCDWLRCWEYPATKGDLYGRFWTLKRRHKAHRLIASWTYGEIRNNYVVDHIACNNPPCVNPLHLLPCTHRQNVLRPGAKSFAAIHFAQTHCKYGHPLEPTNMHDGRSRRSCIACEKYRAQSYYDSHAEIIKTRSKHYYQENKEARSLYTKAYREKNYELIQEKKRIYREANREAIRTSARERRHRLRLTIKENNFENTSTRQSNRHHRITV